MAGPKVLLLDEPAAAFSGRLVPAKGAAALLRAFAGIPHGRLLIAGADMPISVAISPARRGPPLSSVTTCRRTGSPSASMTVPAVMSPLCLTYIIINKIINYCQDAESGGMRGSAKAKSGPRED